MNSATSLAKNDDHLLKTKGGEGGVEGLVIGGPPIMSMGVWRGGVGHGAACILPYQCPTPNTMLAASETQAVPNIEDVSFTAAHGILLTLTPLNMLSNRWQAR